jgi:hypothetical protein
MHAGAARAGRDQNLDGNIEAGRNCNHDILAEDGRRDKNPEDVIEEGERQERACHLERRQSAIPAAPSGQGVAEAAGKGRRVIAGKSTLGAQREGCQPREMGRHDIDRRRPDAGEEEDDERDREDVVEDPAAAPPPTPTSTCVADTHPHAPKSRQSCKHKSARSQTYLFVSSQVPTQTMQAGARTKTRMGMGPRYGTSISRENRWSV